MTQWVVERNGWESHRHTDMSGDVLFVAPDGAELQVPGEIVLATVAAFVRDRKLLALSKSGDLSALGVSSDPIMGWYK